MLFKPQNYTYFRRKKKEKSEKSLFLIKIRPVRSHNSTFIVIFAVCTIIFLQLKFKKVKVLF